MLISNQVNGASATQTGDLGSILSRVKPKTLKCSIHRFVLDCQRKKNSAKIPPSVMDS